jgi:hypothetical protein
MVYGESNMSRYVLEVAKKVEGTKNHWRYEVVFESDDRDLVYGEYYKAIEQDKRAFVVDTTKV